MYDIAQDLGVVHPSVPTICEHGVVHDAVTWEQWCVGVLADLAVLVLALQKNDNKPTVSRMAAVVQVSLRDL